MVHHPNFPPNLSITPNIGSKALAGDDDPDVFGVEAQREAISRYGIAGRVWEAAYALCAYVDGDSDGYEFDPPFVEDPRVPLGIIELGSGTGVVAERVARVVQRTARPGGFVIATDLPDVCPLLQHNLGIHPSTAREDNTVFVRPLAWDDLDHATAIMSEFGSRRWTHVVCSDLVYFPELLGPLLRTLIHLTSPPCTLSWGPPVRVVVSYKIRGLLKEMPFWSAFGLWFSFQPVLARRRVQIRPLDDEVNALEPWTRFGADEDTDRMFIFVAHRRPESITWHVPETDKALIEGIVARGTTAKRGDDTFETILFMSMGIDDTGE